MKDYANHLQRPYQCFMGKWEGVCKTFSPEGEFLNSSAVHMDVYWVDENTWHLHEHFDNLYQVGETVFHTDIAVDGKTCYASNEMLTIFGTEIVPTNYVFTIESNVSGTTVYNNHYFLNADTRRIITHKVRDGKTHIFQIQDFVRIA